MADLIGVFSVRQDIDGTHDWDGTAPAGTITKTDQMLAYPTEVLDKGGLFDLPEIMSGYDVRDRKGAIIAEPALVLLGYRFRLGTPTTWEFAILDQDGNDVVMNAQAAAGEEDFVQAGEPIVIPWGCDLAIETTGSSAVQTATLDLVPYLYHYGRRR